MATLDDVQKLLGQARFLADGPNKVALIDEAVRTADLVGDIDWQFYARNELITACFTGGDPERMLVALSWSLAKSDELGTCYSESSLLWGCKFALSYVSANPHISRAQIHSLREDTIRRFRKYGASMRIPSLYGMYNELTMGYPKLAAEFRPLWQNAPRDEFTEPPDWELYFDALFYYMTDNIDKALELGLPMIDGRDPSLDVSFWMVNLLLMELLKRDERKLALTAHEQAMRQCGENPKYLDHMGVHLAFAALTGNFARATDILNKHLAVALHITIPSAQFTFYLNAWNAAEHMHAVTGKPARLRLPNEFPLWNKEGKYRWSELAAWFGTKAHELEAQFNARNGTDLYTTYFAEAIASRAVAKDWPIRGHGEEI
jgi:hypothetical protein